jgi:hypothetical protein
LNIQYKAEAIIKIKKEALHCIIEKA